MKSSTKVQTALASIRFGFDRYGTFGLCSTNESGTVVPVQYSDIKDTLIKLPHSERLAFIEGIQEKINTTVTSWQDQYFNQKNLLRGKTFSDVSEIASTVKNTLQEIYNDVNQNHQTTLFNSNFDGGQSSFAHQQTVKVGTLPEAEQKFLDSIVLTLPSDGEPKPVLCKRIEYHYYMVSDEDITKTMSTLSHVNRGVFKEKLMAKIFVDDESKEGFKLLSRTRNLNIDEEISKEKERIESIYTKVMSNVLARAL